VCHGRTRYVAFAGLGLLAGWSAFLWLSVKLSAAESLALAGLVLCLAAGAFAGRPGRGDSRLTAGALAWLCSASLIVNALSLVAQGATLAEARGIELAVTPEIIALALWTGTAEAPPFAQARWRGLALGWLVAGEGIWLAVGHLENRGWLFFGALCLIVLTLVYSKRRFHCGWFGAQVVNTIIALLVGIPAVDLALRIAAPPGEGVRIGSAARRPSKITADNAHLFYSYEDSGGDPEAFAAWWTCFGNELFRSGTGTYLDVTPHHTPPLRLRPGGHGMLLDCPITINSRGFRGREIAVPKGNVYRIVCLGESTTFGMTFRKGDKPWPELLEGMINERLKPGRRVEVVNAGSPAWTLSDNLTRLIPDILPLEPDLIISYHGYNGLAMIDPTLPPVAGPRPPLYCERPLRIAAEVEYRLKVRAFVEEFRGGDRGNPVAAAPPLQTPYAKCYRQLIAFAQTNHIRLALGNFCMAIDEHSDHRLVNFYSGFGSGLLYARANAVHSEIVRRLAEQNPGVSFVDTYPGLETQHRKFTDAVHLTQEGRQQLAENMFAGIRAQLEPDLGLSH